MTDDDARETIASLVKKSRTALVTTLDEEGHLVCRPLAMLDQDFDGTLWFFTPDPSPKTDQVRRNDQVNVALADGSDYVSLSGTASVSRDQAKIDELWNRFAEAWFAGGREDPTVALLRVDVATAEYWTLDSPKPIALAKYAKALITGERPDIAENEVVEL